MVNSTNYENDFILKMRENNVKESAQKVFLYNYNKLISEYSTIISENSIDSLHSVNSLESLNIKSQPDFINKTVIIKLNGGLGTSMGLDKAKSLIKIKKDYTFIDIMRVLEYGNDYSRVASIDEHDNITNYLQTKLQID